MEVRRLMARVCMVLIPTWVSEGVEDDKMSVFRGYITCLSVHLTSGRISPAYIWETPVVHQRVATVLPDGTKSHQPDGGTHAKRSETVGCRVTYWRRLLCSWPPPCHAKQRELLVWKGVLLMRIKMLDTLSISLSLSVCLFVSYHSDEEEVEQDGAGGHWCQIV